MSIPEHPRDDEPTVIGPGEGPRAGRHREQDHIDGDLYVVGGDARRGTIDRIAGGQPGPVQRWVTDAPIAALAIGPDSPGAPLR